MLIPIKVRRASFGNKSPTLTESFLAGRTAHRYIQSMFSPLAGCFGPSLRWLSRAAAAAALGVLLTGGAAAQPAGAEPGASAWSPAPKSRARLVSAGPAENGVYRAGVEISLDGNALTYWRNPGDAGVPPEFDFKGSANLANVSVVYPAPERHDEDGSEVFGWRKAVIFPLKVQPKDPAKPVTLALHLRYAACDKICIPSEGRMELTLTPSAPPSLHAARIAHWASLAPQPAAGSGASVRLEPIAGAKKPSWRVRVSPAEAGSDVFAEGDDGWFFDTRALQGDFKLVLAERPSGAPDMTNVRLTLRRPSGAIEFITKLDAGAAAP
jgi:DsbC/DsbD-like thiol-disulfide interchange protein